jgi:glutathione peroxidase
MGLEILAFPCNQFMAQEPKCEEDIKKFARGSFEVKFRLFSKIDVNGPNTHEVFKYLRINTKELKPPSTKCSNAVMAREVPWNFTKFVVDKAGHVIGYFPPTIEPYKMFESIEKALSYNL